MPPRALRKLQRQQEQDRLAALQKISGDEDDEDEDEDEIIESKNTKATSAFALLGSPTDEDHSVNEEADDNEVDEQEPPASNATRASQGQVTSKSRKKKKAKKEKKKARTAKDGLEPPASTKQPELDDIDAALNELRVMDEQKISEHAAGKLPTDLNNFYQLLCVDSKNLKVLNEMKRLFGSSVLEGEQEGGDGGRRRGRGPRQLDLGAALDRRNHPSSRGQGLSERLLRKNIFVQGKDSWVKETGGGLGMEVVEHAEDGTTEYRYVHSSGYQRSQREFDVCVESMDPQRMIYFLQMNPYHISGLLQVAEIARQNQEPAVGADLIERALFSFGRAAHSTFGTAIAEGRARMDFRRPENRELWLAGWRYVRSLGQRGTWRTAYEWAKLLFSLDPEGDPYQIRLVLDQLAIRAGQFTQFLSLASTSADTLDWGQDQANVRISLAIAHDRLKQPREARTVLAEAVQKWPWIIAQLLRELDIDRIPKSVWGKEPRTPRETLHTVAYATRAKDLWNTPEAVSLLMEVAETTDALPSLPPPDDTEIELNEARHILLDETPSLLGLLPRTFTNSRTSASDPLPPIDNLPSYNDPSLEDIDGSDSEDTHTPTASEEEAAVIALNEGDRGVWGWAQRMLGINRRAESEGDRNDASRDSAAAPAPDNAAARRAEARQAHALAQEQLLAEQEDAMLAEALRQSQREMEARLAAEVATGERPGADDPVDGLAGETGTSEAGASTTAPHDALNDTVSASAAANAASEEANDPQRMQRWLAGRGLLALKDFCAAHGTDESAWPFTMQDERAEPVHEYVARAKSLPAGQRRFILDFALPQGAGKAAGEMVRRLVGR